MLKNKFIYFGLLFFLLVSLLVSVLVRNHYANIRNDHKKHIQELNERLADEISNAQLHHQQYIDSIAVSDKQFFHIPTSLPSYCWKGDSLIAWSTHFLVPNFDQFSSQDGVFPMNWGKNSFIGVKTCWGNEFTFLTLIELKTYPEINNQYLEESYNKLLFRSDNFQLAVNDESSKEVIQYNDTSLYTIQFSEDYFHYHDWIVFLVLITDLIVFFSLIFFWYSALQYIKWPIIWQYLAFLAGVLLLRYFSYSFFLPFGYESIDLFNPRFYASATYLPSLGDLMINLGLLVLLIAMLPVRNVFQQKYLRNSYIFALFFISFYLYESSYFLIDSLYQHSLLGLDITDDFQPDLMKFYSWVLLIISLLSYIIILYKIVQVSIERKLLLQLSVLTFVGFLFTFYLLEQSIAYFTVLHFLLLLMLKWHNERLSIEKGAFLSLIYIFIMLLIFTINGTYTIWLKEYQQLKTEQDRMAGNLLLDNDPLLEFLLMETNQKLIRDQIISSSFRKSSVEVDPIIERMQNMYLIDYFDRYEYRLLFFDENEIGLENYDEKKLRDYIEKQQLKLPEKIISNYYHLNSFGNPFSNSYINIVRLETEGNLLGYIVMELSLKRNVPQNVYPELLSDQRFGFENPSSFEYAIYQRDSLVHAYGEFNYERFHFDKLELIEQELQAKVAFTDDYLHRIYEGSTQRKVVVSKPYHVYYQLLSNFSFLFILYFSCIILLVLTYSFYLNYTKSQLSLNLKIQLFFNVIFFIPLLSISIVTITFMNAQFVSQKSNDYLQNVSRLSSYFQEIILGFYNGEITEESLAIQVEQLANYVNLDVNIYNSNGKIISSSQPLIFQKNILSPYINPAVFQSVKSGAYKSKLTKEKIGKLNYEVAYVVIHGSDNNEVKAIISSPFFESGYEETKVLVDVIAIIINIFTFIFIVFLILVYAASRALTSPLRFISQRLSGVTLAEENEPIEWNTEDEIGLLVREYNKMLHKLDQSKAILAKTEKESAWREMAKQVAHEIKNPLTPMKLNLQQLRRTSLEKSDSNDNTIKIIDSMLRNIDNLSEIASSFSEFAKMPIPKRELVNISEIVSDCYQLHQNTERCELSAAVEPKLWVMADAQFMERIISNLIINAKQSVAHDQKAKIHIELKKLQKEVLCSVSDNGSGIPEEIRHKVFVPNFSTKYSGSGLGLAIAKRGVEHAGGSIWFEEQKNGKGTVFFIKLPLAPKE